MHVYILTNNFIHIFIYVLGVFTCYYIYYDVVNTHTCLLKGLVARMMIIVFISGTLDECHFLHFLSEDEILSL